MSVRNIARIITCFGGLLAAYILYKIFSHPVDWGNKSIFYSPLALIVLSPYYRLFIIQGRIELDFIRLVEIVIIIGVGIQIEYLALGAYNESSKDNTKLFIFLAPIIQQALILKVIENE